MTDTYSEKVENALLDMLYTHQAAKQAAERKLEAAKDAAEAEELAIAHCQYVVDDYRRVHGMPIQATGVSPVLANEFAHMGPSEFVMHWAAKHDGEVVVKELARVATEAGMFSSRRAASSSIYGVVRRKPFDKVGPGHFKKKAQYNVRVEFLPKQPRSSTPPWLIDQAADFAATGLPMPEDTEEEDLFAATNDDHGDLPW